MTAQPTSGPRRVGFIGLGNMGAPMSRRLAAAGYDVLAYDVVEGARDGVRDEPGLAVADDPVSAAAGADAVILMLPNSEIVENVIFTAGLLDALAPGSIIVDMSSSEPHRTREAAARVQAKGVRFVDAPVSGGVRGAVAGTLAIMVGAAEEDFADLQALFDALGRRVVLAGPVGAGHAVKALNNLMSAAHLLASSEAILAGAAFGVDPATILDIVNESTGRSVSTEVKWPQFILTGTYGSGFGLRLMLKDTKTALDLVHGAGLPAGMSERVVESLSAAADALPATADHTEVARWLQQESGARTGG